MVRAVIFDMDGLLVDSEPLAARAMDDFLARYGLARRPDVHERLLGRRLTEALAIVRDGYGMTDPLEELTELYAGMRLEALRGAVRPMPGAVEIIHFCRIAGLRVALASSGLRAHVDLSLQETGLAGLFDTEVTGDDVTRGKPAPDLFLAAAERLAVPPADCIVFEDAPAGVAAARAAGMRVAAVPGQHGEALVFSMQPDQTLSDLHAGVAWLETLGVSAPVA